MKKKGFTLTEMIAAIVILAIIIVLGVVTFNGIRNNILQKEYDNVVSYLETKAANYTENTGELNVTVERLIEAGYVSPDEASKVLDPRDKSSMNCMMLESTYDNGNYSAKIGKSIGEASSGKCNTYEVSKEIQICVMKSNGTCDKNIEDWYNDNVELGVSIGNNPELSETASIVWKVNGTYKSAKTIKTDVTTINKGTYTVEVKYDDQKEGETVKHFEGTDTVAINIDRAAPTVGTSKVEKANEWTNYNKNVTVSYSDSNGSGVKGIYIGTLPCSSVTNWTTISKLEYSTSLDKGTYHVCVIDLAGNVSDDTNLITIDYIDKQDPKCTIKVVDDRGNEKNPDGQNGWYITPAKLLLTTTDEGDSGVASYDLTTVGTPSYKGKTTDTQGDTASQIYHGYVRDKAGNTATCTKTVKVDLQDPTCVVSAPDNDGENEWYKGNVTLTLNETQRISSIIARDVTTSSTASYSGNRSKIQSEDTAGTTYYGYVKAESGRTGSCNKTVKVDKHDPECNITAPNPDGNNNWYKGNVTLTLNTTKKISNIVGYDITTSTTTSYNKATSKTQSTDTAGTTYYGYVKAESGRTGSCNKTVKVDKQDPICTITAPAVDGNNGWYRENVTLTLNETPKTSSIVGRDITTSSSATYSGNRSKTQTTDTNSTTYYGYVKADSGRTGTCNKTIKKDNTKPTCSVTATPIGSVAGGYFSSPVIMSLSTNAGGGSAIDSYDLTTSSSPSYNKRSTATHNSTGNPTYYGYVRDQAGNTNNCSKSIKVDITAPEVNSISISKRSGYSYNSKNVTITMSGSDQGSGVAAYCYTTTNNSSTCSWRTSSSGSYSNNDTFGADGSGQTITIYGFVKDNVGRISAARSTTYTLYESCSHVRASGDPSYGSCSTSCGSGSRSVSQNYVDAYLGMSCYVDSHNEECYSDDGCCYDCYCYACPPEPEPEPACDWKCQADANSAAWFDADEQTRAELQAENDRLYSENCPTCADINAAGERINTATGECMNCRP